jgi:hypothetical protein
MGLNSRHPDYTCNLHLWQMSGDAYAGQAAVKARDGGFRYLPPTSGQIAKGADKSLMTPGGRSYAAYLARARFHGFFRRAVEGYLGFLWTKKPQGIYKDSLPAPLRYMTTERALLGGGYLDQVLLKVHTEVLKQGTVGLQLDMPDVQVLGQPRPYFTIWCAQSIINWNSDVEGNLTLVVLDESGAEMDPTTLEWKSIERYRVLMLDQGVAKWGVFNQTTQFNPSQMRPLSVRGKTISYLPFVMINFEDIHACAKPSPLMDLVYADLGLYRLEADYRTSLFMQTQSTFFHKGLKQAALEGGTVMLGAEAALEGAAEWSDVKYAGVGGEGLSEMRQAVENDKAQAARLAGDLVDDRSRQKESGEALDLKHGAQTSKLTQLALTTAEGLQLLLRYAAEWTGAAPGEIEVKPNLEFVHRSIDGAQLKAIMEAMVLGAPFSKKSLHAWGAKHNLTEMRFEDEVAQIEEEGPFVDLDKVPQQEPIDGSDEDSSAEDS